MHWLIHCCCFCCLVQVFERGVSAIPLSVDLWLHYIAFTINQCPLHDILEADEKIELYDDWYIFYKFLVQCLQWFDAVGCAAGRVSGQLKLSGGVLVSYCRYLSEARCIFAYGRADTTATPCLTATTTTTIVQQPFYGSLDFVQDNPGELVSEETFTLSPVVFINHPLSASSIFYDPWHPPCSIYAPEIFFHNFSSSFLWGIGSPNA